LPGKWRLSARFAEGERAGPEVYSAPASFYEKRHPAIPLNYWCAVAAFQRDPAHRAALFDFVEALYQTLEWQLSSRAKAGRWRKALIKGDMSGLSPASSVSGIVSAAVRPGTA